MVSPAALHAASALGRGLPKSRASNASIGGRASTAVDPAAYSPLTLTRYHWAT